MEKSWICKVEDCNRPKVAHGFCGMHAARFRRHGNTETVLSRILPPELIIEGDIAKIPLTKGLFAIIDIEDIKSVSGYIYHAAAVGYAARREGYKIIYLHQDIKGSPPEGYEVDHNDRNKLNNRRKNLIFKTHTDNMRNTLRHKERIGVSFDRTHRKWKAYIDNPGQKRINVGTFWEEFEAKEAVLNYKQTHSK